MSGTCRLTASVRTAKTPVARGVVGISSYRQGGLHDGTGPLLGPKDEEAEWPQRQAEEWLRPSLAVPSRLLGKEVFTRSLDNSSQLLSISNGENSADGARRLLSQPDFWEGEPTWSDLDCFPPCLSGSPLL